MRTLLRGARLWPVLLLAALAVVQPEAAPANTASVAAFARLFGVIRYFYPSDRAASLDWDQFAVDGAKKTLGAADGASLQATLRQLVEPLGPGIEIGTTLPKPVPPASSRERLIAWRYLGPGFSDLAVSPYRAKRTNRALTPAARVSMTAEIFDDAPPNAGDHVDLDLGLGLQARVPLVLTDSDAGVRPSSAAPAAAPGAPRAGTADPPDLPTRLADVIVAWNVFRHFYPYWSEVNVDWDGRLLSYLNAASMATTRRDELEVLGQLVADARDGHGHVQDLRVRERQAWLPIQVALVENQVVVSASRAHDAPVGAIVTTIDGMPARQRIARESQRWSGTAQWKTVQALRYVAAGATGSLVSMALDAGSGSHAVDLRRDAAEPAPESRPEPVAELSPGLSYVDVTRVPWTQLAPRLEALSHATGIVFDVRGYPTDAGLPILRHLLDAPESDLWMHVPKIVGPFGATAGSLSVGWNLRPATPHLGAKVVFLTDARAISYAESVLGYVASHRLGTIVGATTAGTNGNTANFSTPGGFAIVFTGMRVTQHDGTSHHLVGIRPDIPVSPTIDGLRSGHDEVLERGLTVAGTSR